MKDKLILPILILVLNAVEINAREFSSLFEVRISAQEYTNVNYGLNRAFDKLLIKLQAHPALNLEMKLTVSKSIRLVMLPATLRKKLMVKGI